MQTLTSKVWALQPPYGIFNETVLKNLFSGHTPGARKALLHRALKQQEVVVLKRGLYCLNRPFRQQDPHPFILSELLYSPSYISVESALRHHGLIPEMTFGVSAVTTKRRCSFTTVFGHFDYFCVPSNAVRAGVELIRMDKDAWAFVATPLKAIADLIYLRREVSWEKDGLDFLTQSMRIEPEDLEELSWDRFDEIHNSLKNKRVLKYLNKLQQALS